MLSTNLSNDFSVFTFRLNVEVTELIVLYIICKIFKSADGTRTGSVWLDAAKSCLIKLYRKVRLYS